MNGPIRRIAIGVFICLASLLVGVTWYQVVTPGTLVLPCPSAARSAG
jgi:hypothetical protein